MHINGIIITKQFISHWNFKRLRGSVGRAQIHIGYKLLKTNEIKDIFLLYIVCCLVCCVRLYIFFTYFTLVRVTKLHPVASRLPRREEHLLRLSFGAR